MMNAFHRTGGLKDTRRLGCVWLIVKIILTSVQVRVC